MACRAPIWRLSPVDRAELLDTIGLEVARLRRLVENLLDLSRLQAGAAVTHPELWPVDELLARAAAEVAPAGRVQIDRRRTGCRRRKVDAVQLQRVLVNLIENALKFRPRGAPSSCTAARGTVRWCSKCSTVAAGSTRARRTALLEPFVRGGRWCGWIRARPRDRAAGSSPSTAAALSLESRPGGGTCVASDAAGRAVSRGGLRVSTRVLVVDDEPQFLRALVTNLRGAGYEVETAATAAEALAAAGLHPPDAVILDLLLPDGSGTDVCRELQHVDRRADRARLGGRARRRRRSPRSTRAPTTT